GSEPVPTHLRDSTANAMIARHEGEESQSSKYKYPHDYPGAWVEQQYLPEGMASPHWYSAKQIGYEQSVYERMSTHGSDVAEDGAVEEQDDMKPATPKGSSPIAAKPMARPAPKPSQKGKK
ncbi:MAG: hypothetical protein U0528_17660, partial [Anaerolineae bacterium]